MAPFIQLLIWPSDDVPNRLRRAARGLRHVHRVRRDDVIRPLLQAVGHQQVALTMQVRIDGANQRSVWVQMDGTDAAGWRLADAIAERAQPFENHRIEAGFDRCFGGIAGVGQRQALAGDARIVGLHRDGAPGQREPGRRADDARSPRQRPAI